MSRFRIHDITYIPIDNIRQENIITYAGTQRPFEAECFYDAVRKMWPSCFHESSGEIAAGITFRPFFADTRNTSRRRVYLFDCLRILVEMIDE